MSEPNLVDLVQFWLQEHASRWTVHPTNWPKGAVACLHFKGFGQQIAIFDNKIIFDSANDKKPLEVMAADPKLFELLSNRLYILEQGFQKALESRVETAKRENWSYLR